jgi:hypothetical protein
LQRNAPGWSRLAEAGWRLSRRRTPHRHTHPTERGREPKRGAAEDY